MSQTDRNIIEELFTGEFDAPEPQEEMDLRVTGSFAESQQRLASAIDARTGNWLEHQQHATPSPNCHLCKEWAGWRMK